MSAPLYQDDGRWAGLLLGHGPGRIGGEGCVLVSLCNAARELGTRPDLIPPNANNAALKADAFQHWDDAQQKMLRADELWMQKAAPAFGLEAPDAGVVAGEPGDAQLREALRNVFSADNEVKDDVTGEVVGMRGVALLRVDTGPSRHTICATKLDVYTSVVHCLDPAIGTIDLGWPALEAVASWGRRDVRRYRVVGVRPVWVANVARLVV